MIDNKAIKVRANELIVDVLEGFGPSSQSTPELVIGAYIAALMEKCIEVCSYENPDVGTLITLGIQRYMQTMKAGKA